MTVARGGELSAVDASVAIFVDVQNTLVNTLLRKWASGRRKRRYLPVWRAICWARYALSDRTRVGRFGLQTRATNG